MRAAALALAFGLLCWALALWFVFGCATGHVHADGEMYCAAIGEDAKVTYSAPQGEAGVIMSAPTKLVTCEGGPILPSILDGLGAVVKAAFSVLPWL